MASEGGVAPSRLEQRFAGVRGAWERSKHGWGRKQKPEVPYLAEDRTRCAWAKLGRSTLCTAKRIPPLYLSETCNVILMLTYLPPQQTTGHLCGPNYPRRQTSSCTHRATASWPPQGFVYDGPRRTSMHHGPLFANVEATTATISSPCYSEEPGGGRGARSESGCWRAGSRSAICQPRICIS